MVGCRISMNLNIPHSHPGHGTSVTPPDLLFSEVSPWDMDRITRTLKTTASNTIMCLLRPGEWGLLNRATQTAT